jgi:aminoglycoside phosphotransferase (APT) family kinase protein
MVTIDEDLVRELVAGQFPQWRDLPVTAVARQGWDNRTFRLGDELTVRLPSGEGYVAAVEKEDRWLPELAPALPYPVPVPVAVGVPAQGYPVPWSVRRWLPGVPLDTGPEVDRTAFAEDLAGFLTALWAAPAGGGPAAGRHSFYRGCHPRVYADEVDAALEQWADTVDVATCRAIWADADASEWTAAPVWFHGDFAAGNLLVSGGRLAAVIDFGTSGVGDPACDLVIAWAYLRGDDERQAFRAATGLDDDTWRRARAWVTWKCLITLGDGAAERTLAEALADPVIG